MILRFWLCVFFSVLILHDLQAQFTTEGKEFWVGFMDMSNVAPTQELFITSRYNTTGTVSIPLQGWTQNFSVASGQTTVVNLPIIHTTTNETVQNKGIYIVSLEDISVYAVNKIDYGTEASLVLPKKALGNATEYVINAYKGYETGIAASQSQFLIVAMEANTQLTITPKQKTFGGRLAGQSFQITLEAGQVYQVQTFPGPSPTSEDLMGSIVESTNQKAFALFGGVNLASMLCGDAQQHLYEQNYPVDTWGKEYLVLPYKGASKGYVYRVLASEDNTQVQIKIGNNAPSTITLQKGAFHQGEVNTLIGFAGEIFVSADKPISVSKYLKGRGCNGISSMDNRGDPNMLILNALNQPVQRATFNTISTPTDAMDAHFVNIITRTNSIDKVKLQGSFLSSSLFQPVSANSTYSYAQVDLVPYGIDPVLGKSFTLESDSTFIAYAYGYGNASSYAYSVGANFVKLDYKFTASKEKICLGETIDFVGEGTNILSYTWDFGDGSPTQTGQNVSHTYTQAGNYTAKMTVQILGSFVAHTATKPIEVYPLAVPDLGADQTHCVGKGFTLDSKVTLAGVNYVWKRDGVVLPTAQGGTLQTDVAGKYVVEATTDKGCMRVDTVVLAYFPFTQAEIQNLLPEYFTDGANVSLEGLPTGGVFRVNGSVATELKPTVMQVGKYKVVYTYQDVNGCVSKDSVMVQITNPAVRFFMPNSFTPNGDGLNDELKIFGDNFRYLDWRIYNRWGELIFLSDSQEKTWNGTTNGKPAPAGVYYCTVEYTEPREKKRIKYQSLIRLVR